MFHAATSKSKQQSDASRSQYAVERGQELAPHTRVPGYALSSGSPTGVRQQFARLQRTYGNQAILRALSSPSPAIQTKLTVNKPGDPFEQEADRVADQVMRMTNPPTLQRKCSACQEEDKLQRKCAECEEEEKRTGLQRKQSAPGPQFAPPSVQAVLNSPGRSLDPGVRSFMEPRFGYDFNQVRVHTDERAAESARRVNARAYTVGNHAVFAPGQYAPGSSGGRQLIAHELAHVIQQADNGSQRIQRKVVDDAEHVTCRGSRADAVTRLKSGEDRAIALAQQAAAAIRSYVPGTGASGETPASRTFRDLVWRRFQLDYNDTQARCTILPELASRFERIASHIGSDVHTYRCGAPGTEPPGECTDKPHVGVAWSATGGKWTAICESSWSDSAEEFADTIMHEWYHSIFRVSDCEAINVENAQCYPQFARELAGTATSSDYATCCKPPTGILPALTVTAEAAKNCSPPGRLALELFGGASLNQTIGGGPGTPPPGVSAAVSLGLRYSLRSDRLIVVNPVLGAHLLYLPSGDRNGAHVLAALAEFGVRFQQLNVPLRGLYFDVRLGAYAGLDIPANRSGTPPPSVTGLAGASGAVGVGYRWERIDLGVQARDMLDTTGTNKVLILGGGALTF